LAQGPDAVARTAEEERSVYSDLMIEGLRFQND
jgi:hypothetical protein